MTDTGSTLVDGKFIPGGTRIGWNILYIQRSKAIFGPDADVFRPERWLGIDSQKHREMINVVELVFGYGRWGCSGKSVAFMELNKVYVEVRAIPPLFVLRAFEMLTWLRAHSSYYATSTSS